MKKHDNKSKMVKGRNKRTPVLHPCLPSYNG